MSPGWLAQLAPSHAPQAPGWWPPAPGWWVIGLLSVLLALALGRWWRDPDRRHRRVALAELRRIRRAAQAAGSDAAAESARAIENLLRRYAIAVFGRSRVAALSGEAWLGFLGAGGAAALAGEAGRSLLAAAFGGSVRDQRALWLACAESFVRRARRVPRRRAPARTNRPGEPTSGPRSSSA